MASLGIPSQSAVGEDEIDIGDIFRSLGRQWRKVAVVAIIITAAAIWLVLSARPQFTVTGAVYLGNTTGGPNEAGALAASGLNFLTDFQSVSDVDTQVALIQSSSLLERAILETGLNASITPEGRPLLRYWRWRYIYGQAIDAYAPQPGDLKVLDATISDPGIGGIGYEVVFGKDGNYSVQVPGGWFSGDYTVFTGKLGQPAAGGGLAFLIQPALPGVIPPEGSRYTLIVQQANAMAQAFPLKTLVVMAGGTTSAQTNIANLTFNWNNPFQAQEFLTQLMNDYIATQLSWKTESASATEAFVSNELNKISASLATANTNLASYQSKTGILDVPANAQSVITQLANYEAQQATLQLQQEALQQLAQSMKDPQGGINPYLVSQSGDPAIATIAGQLATEQATLQSDRVQFTPNAPEIQAEEAKIARMEQSIATMVQNDQASAARSLQIITQQIDDFRGKVKNMPREGLQVLTLTQASTVYGQLYVLLMQKAEEAEVSKAATIVDTRIVSAAEIPLFATKPKASLTVFAGLFLGIFAGIGLVLAQRAMAGTFQSDDDIRRSVQLPVYGLVPRLSRSEISRGVLSERPQSPFSEAFRLLRSNLYQSASGRQSKVILISSASSADGKTTISANLAKFLADDGKRVVLIDGDLHRGRVHEVLKINQTPGLTEWIVTTEPSRLQPIEGQRFVVLPTGTFPPNPSELLNEALLVQIFNALRTQFDYVIVDCPPLPAVADTMPLGQNADLILSVVHIGHTPRRAFMLHNETISTLDRRHGIIINGVVGSVYGYGYGYGYSYAYGYADAPQAEPATFVGRIWRTVTRIVKRLS